MVLKVFFNGQLVIGLECAAISPKMWRASVTPLFPTCRYPMEEMGGEEWNTRGQNNVARLEEIPNICTHNNHELELTIPTHWGRKC